MQPASPLASIPSKVVADFHIGDMASVWKPTPTLSETVPPIACAVYRHCSWFGACACRPATPAAAPAAARSFSRPRP